MAPFRQLSIPWLELCGTCLLADIISYVRSVLCIPASNVYCWTDSMIVLFWLKGDPSKLKIIVGNRISHVVGLTTLDRWAHVQGTDNPADCASHNPLSYCNMICSGMGLAGCSLIRTLGYNFFPPLELYSASQDELPVHLITQDSCPQLIA